MGEKAELFQLGQLVAHRRRGDVQARPLDDRLRAHWLARLHVLLDHPHEDRLLTRVSCGCPRSIPRSIVVLCRGFSDQLCGYASAQEAATACEPKTSVDPLNEAEPLETVERPRLDGACHLPERNGPVQAQAKHETLYDARLSVQLLDLPRGAHPGGERGEVRSQLRGIAPAQVSDGRDRADSEAEVVPTQPVGHVVPALAPFPAEVGRLVPPEPGSDEGLDHLLEIALHGVLLAGELGSPGVDEPRSRLGLELVAGEVLRRQSQSRCEIALQVGGALTGNSVDEIQRDVVKTGITQMVKGATVVVGTGAPLEHGKQPGIEALRPERDSRHAALPQKRGELGRHGLRVRLDSDLGRPRERVEQTGELSWLCERRRAAAQEDGLDSFGEHVPLEFEFRQQRIHVDAVAFPLADERDEIAVPAPVRTEREVDVEMPGTVRSRLHHLSPSRLRTARKASWGTSTEPTCFMRFLPFFWRSSSFRFRVTSPP